MHLRVSASGTVNNLCMLSPENMVRLSLSSPLITRWLVYRGSLVE